MALDFELFPPKEEVPDTPPSALVWAIVFFVLVILSVLGVLMLWPKDESTSTLWFWTCVTVFPTGLASFVVLSHFSAYEGRRNGAIEWNKARDNYIETEFARERRPMVALASAFRFSSNEKEDTLDQVLGESLTLTTHPTPAKDPATVTARWFQKPATDARGNPLHDDVSRHERVLTWLFGELLAKTVDAVKTLPRGVRLSVHLAVTGTKDADVIVRLWNATWTQHKLFPLRPTVTSTESGLMLLDEWLNRAAQTQAHEARLMVAVNLSPLLGAAPPDGSAEAGSAVLLMPEAVQRANGLPCQAVVCRPNHVSAAEGREVALARAAQWATVRTSDTTHLWLAGLEAHTAGQAGAPLVTVGAEAGRTDLDHRVGHAGEASPWLALTAACMAVAAEPAVHVIASGSGAAHTYAVVRGPQPE